MEPLLSIGSDRMGVSVAEAVETTSGPTMRRITTVLCRKGQFRES